MYTSYEVFVCTLLCNLLCYFCYRLYQFVVKCVIEHKKSQNLEILNTVINYVNLGINFYRNYQSQIQTTSNYNKYDFDAHNPVSVYEPHDSINNYLSTHTCCPYVYPPVYPPVTVDKIDTYTCSDISDDLSSEEIKYKKYEHNMCPSAKCLNNH